MRNFLAFLGMCFVFIIGYALGENKHKPKVEEVVDEVTDSTVEFDGVEDVGAMFDGFGPEDIEAFNAAQQEAFDAIIQEEVENGGENLL